MLTPDAYETALAVAHLHAAELRLDICHHTPYYEQQLRFLLRQACYHHVHCANSIVGIEDGRALEQHERLP